MHSIDLAYFDCLCGHRCTAPEAVNPIARQMDVFEIEPISFTRNDEGKNVPVLPDAQKEAVRLQELRAKHPGNTFSIRTEGAFRVTRIVRSYAKAEFDKDKITQSDHITLKCPQCDKVFYEVNYEGRE